MLQHGVRSRLDDEIQLLGGQLQGVAMLESLAARTGSCWSKRAFHDVEIDVAATPIAGNAEACQLRRRFG
jgi:hypothetical protein